MKYSEKIAELGQEGWELFSVVAIPIDSQPGFQMKRQAYLYHYFKKAADPIIPGTRPYNYKMISLSPYREYTDEIIIDSKTQLWEDVSA